MMSAYAKEIEVLPPYPGVTFSGRPFTECQFRWKYADGTTCTGSPSLNSLLKNGMNAGFAPGDLLIVTVTVIPKGAQP